MTIRSIDTRDAPTAIGPYVQAVAHGGVLYCSGALPLDPKTGALVDASVGAETAQCLANLSAICAEAGTSLGQALKMTIYTTRLDAFADINEVYGAAFGDRFPARATIGVAGLPMGARVEIEALVALRF